MSSNEKGQVIVTEDGNMRRYFDLCGDFAPFSLLGNSVPKLSCERFPFSNLNRVLKNTVWVLPVFCQLIAVSHYNEPPSYLLLLLEERFLHWSLMPPAYTLSRSVEALLGVSKTVYMMEATEAEDKMLQNGPFKHISISYTGRFVALFTNDRAAQVLSSDFQINLKFSEY
jgi:vacuolar protein sorting-associated protein 16